MKIAIISDTHDNLAYFKRAVDWIKKEGIKTIIHCGDIFKPETIREVLKDFEGEIHVIFSPADADFSKIPKDSFENLPGVKTYEKFGTFEIDGRRIAFTHFPEIARELAETQNYDLVFYGHTHKPWEEQIGKTRMVNPGNLANIFYKPTFAVYDTKTDELGLKILEKL
jgi:putative phosphoesterase